MRRTQLAHLLYLIGEWFMELGDRIACAPPAPVLRIDPPRDPAA